MRPPPPETEDGYAARRACLPDSPAAPILRRTRRLPPRYACRGRNRSPYPECSCPANPRVRLRDRLIHHIDQVAILAANVDVARVRIHRQARDQHAFDQLVRIVLDQHAIFAGAGLALVAVDHDVLGLGRGARHEAPLHSRGEARAAAAAQVGGLDLFDDLLGVIFEAFMNAW